jgi:hypothetical protein
MSDHFAEVEWQMIGNCFLPYEANLAKTKKVTSFFYLPY